MIASERDVFIAGHVTPTVKTAMRVQAARENLSLSAWLFKVIVKALQEAGHQVTDRV